MLSLATPVISLRAMTSTHRPHVEQAGYPEAIEALFEERWSDGLPLIPATNALIDAMIAGGTRGAEEAIGNIPERQITLQVWQAATCAVMAGCKPEYFPVVLATWEAMFDPRFNLHTAISSTGGAAMAALVSGPYAEKIGMRSGSSVFGPGNRPNATIGRAIRLGIMSVLKALPGELDASAYGHGGKYSFHFAERAPPAGWPTVREQLGWDLSATTVTVMPAEAPRQVMQRWQPTADGMLRLFGKTMCVPSMNATGTLAPFMVAIGPEHVEVIAGAGLKPRDVREALSEYSRVTPDELLAAGIDAGVQGTRYAGPDEKGRFITALPDSILVMTTGGIGAGWSQVIPSWSWLKSSSPASRAVRVPGEPAAVRDPSRQEVDFAGNV